MQCARGTLLIALASNGLGLFVIPTAVAGDEPPIILGDGVITVAEGKPAAVDIAAHERVRFTIVGSVTAIARCVGLSPARDLCAAPGGVARLQITATSTTPGKGTLVVSDPASGRTASREVVIAGSPETAPPKKLTVQVTGCARWYRTILFGCPSDGPRTDDVDSDADPPTGSAVVSGGAGVGRVTFADRTGQSSVATVQSLDGFGESSGTLGEGDDAIEITVRRRAPLGFGYVVVLLGAALAALFGWFTDWARAKSAGDIAANLYNVKSAELAARREDLRRRLGQSGVQLFAQAWGLQDGDAEEPARPASVQQRDPASVAAYVTDGDRYLVRWRYLEALLTVTADVNRRGARHQLALWLREIIAKGPAHEEFAASLALADAVRRALREWAPNDERVAHLLGCLTSEEVRDTLLLPPPPPSDDRRTSSAIEGPRVTHAHSDPSVRYRRRRVSLVGVLIGMTLVVAFVVPLTSVNISGPTLPNISRPTWPAVGATLLYVIAAGALVVAIVKAHRQRRFPVLLVAVIGSLLAAAFGGADALDTAKGWGSFGDVARSLGASFTVAGTAQLLRFGLPKTSED